MRRGEERREARGRRALALSGCQPVVKSVSLMTTANTGASTRYLTSLSSSPQPTGLVLVCFVLYKYNKVRILHDRCSVMPSKD